MGRFSKGRILTSDEVHEIYQSNIKPRAVEQLLDRWLELRDVNTPQKLWGEEMEWMLVRFKDDEQRVVVPIDLEALRERAEQQGSHVAHWAAECGCFQIETCPPEPHTGAPNELLKIEQSLIAQQQFFRTNFLEQQKSVDFLMLAEFPMNGCPHYTDPDSNGPSQPSKVPYPSIFTNTSKIISVVKGQPELLMRQLTNMIERAGGQKYFHAPVFVDEKTPRPFMEDLAARYGGNERTQIVRQNAIHDHILLEGFGVGLTYCAMQVTQQLRNREEACFVYDQLANVSPIIMALTAAAPFCRGYLTAWDSRWEITIRSGDHRTPSQRRPFEATKLADGDESDADRPVGYTRMHSIEMYTSEDAEHLNDVPQTIDNEVYRTLVDKANVPKQFARYISQYFVMEPLLLTEEEVRKQTEKDFLLFSSIIDMTIWTVVRLKFPVLKHHHHREGQLHITTSQDEGNCTANSGSANVAAGWRVEFRPMDVQANAFQNSAFIVFVVLVTRMLIKYRIDLRVPLSLLERNIDEAVKTNAYTVARFWWRRMRTLPTDGDGDGSRTDANDLVRLTAAEIMCGKADEFVGLIPLVEQYVDTLHQNSGDDVMSSETKDAVKRYLKFLGDRACGRDKTVAEWMRSFVCTHKDYKKDSFVPPNVMYDMMREYQKFQL